MDTAGEGFQVLLEGVVGKLGVWVCLITSQGRMNAATRGAPSEFSLPSNRVIC